MTLSKAQFRWLVTVSIVVAFAALVASLAAESRVPQPLRDHIAAQKHASDAGGDVAMLIVGMPLFIVWIISTIGLYRFWPIARPLTVLAWIVILILQAFTGLGIEFGITSSLFELDALLGGIIITVIYLTPAQTWFQKRPQN